MSQIGNKMSQKGMQLFFICDIMHSMNTMKKGTQMALLIMILICLTLGNAAGLGFALAMDSFLLAGFFTAAWLCCVYAIYALKECRK